MSDLDWLVPGEQSVFRSYARAARRLFDQFDKDLQRDVGMPRTYFEILWFLNEAPEHSLRMSDLADLTRSQPSRITHAVSRLEQAYQVRRELCAADRRGWYTVLTDDGLKALQAAAPRYAESVRRHFLEPLTPAEQHQLERICNKLLSSFEESEVDRRALESLGASE